MTREGSRNTSPARLVQIFRRVRLRWLSSIFRGGTKARGPAGAFIEGRARGDPDVRRRPGVEWIRECQAGGDLRVTILGGGHRGPEAKEHGREKESHNVTKNPRNIACSKVKKKGLHLAGRQLLYDLVGRTCNLSHYL